MQHILPPSYLFRVLALAGLTLTLGCETTKNRASNAQESYREARKSYDDEHYKEAIENLSQFQSRFPYSRYAVSAQLFIAHSHFHLKEYAQAARHYQQLALLHPNHPDADLALYKVGQCYWNDASHSEDREQHFTKKALTVWEKLQRKYPRSPHVQTVLPLMKEGRENLAASELFVARYYCRKEQWLNCVYLLDIFISHHHHRHPDLTYKAVVLALTSLSSLGDAMDAGHITNHQHLLIKDVPSNGLSTFMEQKRALWLSRQSTRHLPRP